MADVQIWILTNPDFYDRYEKQTNDNSTQVEFEREIGWIFSMDNHSKIRIKHSNHIRSMIMKHEDKKTQQKTNQQQQTASTPRTENQQGSDNRKNSDGQNQNVTKNQSTGVNRNKIEKESNEKAGGSP